MERWKFEPDYTVAGRHYAHPCVSWNSVIAGTAVAIAVGFLLSILGVAIGAAAFDPFNFEQQEEGMTTGAALYLVFAQLLAFQAGGYIAARSAPYPDHWGGALNGLLVWATSIIFALLVAAFGSSEVMGSDVLARGVSDAAADMAQQTRGELVQAEAQADALSGTAFLAAAILALGAAGAVAGGWLGAHHPKWDDRPRSSHSMPTPPVDRTA